MAELLFMTLLDNSETLLKKIYPDIIINCVGITTEEVNKSLKNTVFINSHLPHYLDGWTKKQLKAYSF